MPRRPGADSPSATGPTIAEMAERYMTEHVAVRCKPTTQRGCCHILDKFLLPRFHAHGRCPPAPQWGTHMNRSELSSHVATRVHVSKAEADRVIGAVFTAIEDALARGEPVHYPSAC